MKKSNLMMTLVMCFMTVGLFAGTTPGDEDVKVVKVFSLEEITIYNSANSEFSSIESMQLFEKDGEVSLEINGFDSNGKLVKVVKKEGFEIYECGSCTTDIQYPGGPWQPYMPGQLVIFSGDSDMAWCIKCEEEYAPGPE